MKLVSTLIAATALTVSTPAQASEFTEQEAAMCATLSEIAELIMEARQEGVSRRVVTEAIIKVAESEDHKSLYLNMVEIAFSEPRYSTEEFKQGAISDFSSEMYSLCYQAKTND